MVKKGVTAMNITDITEEIILPKDLLQGIFIRQQNLSEKYQEIEKNSGVGYALVENINFSLEDIRWQYLIKDFAWRYVEEITEATQIIFQSKTHFIEEIIDGLHFLIELFIITNLTLINLAAHLDMIYRHFRNNNSVENFLEEFLKAIIILKESKVIFPENFREVQLHAYGSIQHLGNAMNCLKQKPWKQTHQLTDTAKFYKQLSLTFFGWCMLALDCNLGAEEIYKIYYKKSEVNKFRQRSNY